MQLFRRFFWSWNPVVLLKTSASGNSAGRPDPHAERAWRTLYVAAIFETDEKRMAQRIAETKKAMVARAHELFQNAGNDVQEQSAIVEAFQSLRALERCMMSSVASGDAECES